MRVGMMQLAAVVAVVGTKARPQMRVVLLFGVVVVAAVKKRRRVRQGGQQMAVQQQHTGQKSSMFVI